MPKLPALRPREVARILERAGFNFQRQKGSHQLYVKGSKGITIPWHNKDLKKGTLRKIIKETRLTIEEFLTFR